MIKLRGGDHGIDGFGYFRSDEFRTARVAIQCKRYTSGSVGESEIRDFKGTMDSFNAEYGIFVTTGSYTDTAKAIADGARQKNCSYLVHEFDDKMQAAEYLNQNLKAGDVVYLKASNAIGLKEITKYLMEQ